MMAYGNALVWDFCRLCELGVRVALAATVGRRILLRTFIIQHMTRCSQHTEDGGVCTINVYL